MYTYTHVCQYIDMQSAASYPMHLTLCGDIGLFCGCAQLFCGDTGLFCGDISALCRALCRIITHASSSSHTLKPFESG